MLLLFVVLLATVSVHGDIVQDYFSSAERPDVNSLPLIPYPTQEIRVSNEWACGLVAQNPIGGLQGT